jgi:nucleoid-associated protein YgaU
MKSDAKIALVTLALIVLVIVAYVVFVPAKPASPAGSSPTAALPTPAANVTAPAQTPADIADATVASAVQPTAVETVTATTVPSVLTPAAAIDPAVTAPSTQPAALTVTAAPSAGVPAAVAPMTDTPASGTGATLAAPAASTLTAPAAPAPVAGNVDWEGVLRGAKSIEDARVASSTVATSATPAVTPASGPQVSLGSPPAGQPLVGSSVTGATPAAFTGGTYTIGRGDTLSTVAQKAYGSAALWPHIARANPEVNPNRLKLGTVLRIPDVATVKGATASLPAEPTTTSGSSLVVDPAREYQIVSGDSLEKISRKLYGDASKVNAIYDLNRDVIGADPARLRVRTVLKLPAPPTAAR